MKLFCQKKTFDNTDEKYIIHLMGLPVVLHLDVFGLKHQTYASHDVNVDKSVI